MFCGPVLLAPAPVTYQEQSLCCTNRIAVTAVHTDKDIAKAVAALHAAVKEVSRVPRAAMRASP